METNPVHYKLSNKVQLEELGDNQIGIIKVIKSRIIKKDAVKIIAIAEQIKNANPNLEILLVCTQNICSKSLVLLESEGINVKYKEG